MCVFLHLFPSAYRFLSIFLSLFLSRYIYTNAYLQIIEFTRHGTEWEINIGFQISLQPPGKTRERRGRKLWPKWPTGGPLDCRNKDLGYNNCSFPPSLLPCLRTGSFVPFLRKLSSGSSDLTIA